MKITNLLFFLLITSLLKADSPSVISARNTENRKKIQRSILTPRLEKLLHKHRDKFNNIEHYYTWKVIYDIDFGVVFSILFFFIIGMTGLFLYFGRSDNPKDKLASIISGVMLTLSVATFFLVKKNYDDSRFPGCFCLTDKGVLMISNRRNSTTVWIPYKNILFVKKRNLPSYISIDPIMSHAFQNAHIDIAHNLERINKEGKGDVERLTNFVNDVLGVESPYIIGDFSELWIIYKDSSGFSLNTDCSTSAFKWLEDYYCFYKHLQKKIKDQLGKKETLQVG